MKLGDILIVIFTIISIVGLGFTFSLGLHYLEHSTMYKAAVIITTLSSAIDIGLLAIKNEN